MSREIRRQIKKTESSIDDWERQQLVIDKWQPAAREHYKLRPQGRRVMEYRLDSDAIEGLAFEEDSVGVNEEHDVNFMDDIIPGIITRLRESGEQRKVRILDMGCGLGFFTDQLRTAFKDDVEVYGTSLVKGHARIRKRKLLEEIRTNDDLGIPEEKRQHILDTVQPTLHPNDAKWRSVLEMHNFPEFDLIIDTSGELLYAGKGFFPHQSYFNSVLAAATKKLLPGGQLYVSRTHDRDFSKFDDTPQYQDTTVDQNKKSYWGTGLIFTKSAN